MKKIINGRRYDTDTAEQLGYCSYSHPGDFHYFCETLYRKRTGEYFLHGEGGPMSKYARATGQNEWTGSAMIIPLSIEAAYKWAEENLEADEFEKIFGLVPEEDETKRTVTFSLSEAVIAKIKDGAAKAGMTLSDYVARCVEQANE